MGQKWMKTAYLIPCLRPLIGCLLELDFGHSGIDPLQIRQGRTGTVRELDQVWWRGRHHEMTQPPMPLPSSPHLAAIFLLSGGGENGQSRVEKGNLIFYGSLADLRPIIFMEQRVNESKGPRDPLLQKHYRTGTTTFRNQKFERSISIGNAFYHNMPTSAIFLNRDGFDYFETTVGIDDGYAGRWPRTFTFTVKGDNKECKRSRGHLEKLDGGLYRRVMRQGAGSVQVRRVWEARKGQPPRAVPPRTRLSHSRGHADAAV
jgi:hypothetical protein